MTVSISIRQNFPEIRQEMLLLREDIAGRAMVSAVNKTLAQAQTQMIRGITREFNIATAVVRKSLRIGRAVFQKGTLEIEGYLESQTQRGRSLNLIRFDAKQTARGVTFKIKRGSPRQLIPGAFVAKRGNSAGGTVFIRQGKSRLPIAALQTIDVAQMFNTKRVNGPLIDFMRQKFPEIWEHEAAYFVERFNSKTARL